MLANNCPCTVVVDADESVHHLSVVWSRNPTASNDVMQDVLCRVLLPIWHMPRGLAKSPNVETDLAIKSVGKIRLSGKEAAS